MKLKTYFAARSIPMGGNTIHSVDAFKCPRLHNGCFIPYNLYQDLEEDL